MFYIVILKSTVIRGGFI